MEITKQFKDQYFGKRVFITGHTGFKGSWLIAWLLKLGAIVKGYSLPPNTDPAHYNLIKAEINSVYADVRDKEKILKEIAEFNPHIIFHLAAQPLVRYAYINPYETYETNILGTVSLFEAAKHCNSLLAIIVVTTDKCYFNNEWVWSYRENDRLGGFDPYSSSKASVELITEAYRHSYFNIEKYGKEHNTLLASVRAGNVIGGGDWAADRLIPDIIRAVSANSTLNLRNPKAIRPWQHVLEPLSGYLLLGQRLLEGDITCSNAWNFGPSQGTYFTVEEVVEYLKSYWPRIKVDIDEQNFFHESRQLRLDSTKARIQLNWTPLWENEQFKKTAEWYKEFYEEQNIRTDIQLKEYFDDAIKYKAVWINTL